MAEFVPVVCFMTFKDFLYDVYHFGISSSPALQSAKLMRIPTWQLFLGVSEALWWAPGMTGLGKKPKVMFLMAKVGENLLAKRYLCDKTKFLRGACCLDHPRSFKMISTQKSQLMNQLPGASRHVTKLWDRHFPGGSAGGFPRVAQTSHLCLYVDHRLWLPHTDYFH